MTCRFTVPGRPVPKERPRFNTRTGHAYTPRRTQDYEAKVGWQARIARVMLTEKDVRVTIRLYARGKRRPDADNCAKSILDSLQGIAYVNDRQVRHLDVGWEQSEDERAEIEIEEVP